jgi:hypothetical protein
MRYVLKVIIVRILAEKNGNLDDTNSTSGRRYKTTIK